MRFTALWNIVCGLVLVIALPAQPASAENTALVGTHEFGAYLHLDPASGRARIASGLGLYGNSGVAGSAFDPGTNTLYACESRFRQLITIEPATGQTNAVGPLGFYCRALAFDSNAGTLYAFDDDHDRLLAVDPATAESTVIGPVGFGAVEGLAFDPNNNILYGANTSADQLITIDTVTGTGTAVGPLGSSYVGGLTFDPNTSTLYGSDYSSDQLITINPVTGLAISVGPLGFDVRALAFDSNTSTLYGLDPLVARLITINTSTGQGTVVGPLGFVSVMALAFDPNTNTLYGVDAADELITIDWTSGQQGAIVGPIGFDTVEGLAFDPNTNTLYGSDTATDQLITLNQSTGQGTAVGALGYSDVTGLAFDPNTSTLYGTDNNTDALIAINTSTGQGSHIGFLGVSLVEGLTFDANTGTLFGADRDGQQLITINTATGQGTAVEPGRILGVTGLAFDPNTNMLYGAEIIFFGSGWLHNIDPATGLWSAIGGLGSGGGCLTFDHNTSTLYGVVGLHLATIDAATGEAAQVAALDFTAVALAFDPGTNTLYAVNYATDQLMTIDTGTWQETTVGWLGFEDVEGLAFDPNSNTLYGLARDAEWTRHLITIDTATGLGTAVGPFGGLHEIADLAFDPGTNTLYGVETSHGEVITIDTTTGQVTAVGTTPFKYFGGLAAIPDCNRNGIPDGQDIADGTSQDINTDGIPDECLEWTGAAGDNLWNTASNWDPPTVPDNTVDQTYVVTIEGPASVVNLDIDAEIDHLDLLNQATLHINGGNLTIESDASLTSEGLITVTGTRGITTVGQTVMTDVCTAGARGPTGCLPPRLSISDTGYLDGTTLSLDGGATVDLQEGADITLSGQLKLDRGGTYRADPSRTADTSASLNAGSVLITSDGTSAGALILEDSMSAAIQGDCRLESDCAMFAADSAGCLPPRLEVYENASLTIGGSLVINGFAIVNVGGLTTTGLPRSVSARERLQGTHSMTLSVNFINYLTTPLTFDWSEASVLLDGVFQFFEAAGVDRCAIDSGFTGNFEIGAIEVAAGTTVTFIDSIVNTTGDEAVYVNELTLREGATLVADGAAVYYRSLLDEGATILTANGGRFFPSDESSCEFDCDCEQTPSDPCTYDKCIGDLCMSVPNAYGDVDHNEALNLFDIFCILDGIGGNFETCPFDELDIEPCAGNGALNLFDVFAILDAIGGYDACCGSL